MSGRTGKMTAEALAARGPRMALAQVDGKLKIFDNEHDVPVGATIIAKSFSLNYLKKIEKTNRLF
jgi:hypothetical protein